MNSNGFQVRPTSLDPDRVDLIIDALRGWRYAARMLATVQDRPSPHNRDLAKLENVAHRSEDIALAALTVTVPVDQLKDLITAAQATLRSWQVNRHSTIGESS